MATEPTNFRLDSDAKKKAYSVFKKVGIKPAQAVNLFLHQVAMQGGLPFDVKIPNAKTVDAVEELSKGKGKKYKTAKQMYDDLGI